VKTRGTIIAALLAAYLATGFYVVSGNQVGVVRRLGRAVRDDDGRLALKPNGWYYDLPWPLSRVDRVNLSETLTVSIGAPSARSEEPQALLLEAPDERESQFLTGDRNILQLDARVHYRVSRERIEEYLFGQDAPRRRLARLGESLLTDLVLQSGVDFVHTFGRNELRSELLRRLQEEAARQQLGFEIEDVTFEEIAPPLRVKADFLDVMNARADRETYIQQALADAQTKRSQSRAKARRTNDDAVSYRERTLADARSRAERFSGLLTRIEEEASSSPQTYADARSMAMQRIYVDQTAQILSRVASKVFLDGDKPVDLTIWQDPTR
jgi:membrane protease subunit HflK